MDKKLIDYEGFEAYSKGVKNKYAEKKDIPTSLSSLQEDTRHRLTTDDEKRAWNNKVDKIDGKQLSTNDYTNEAKTKVDNIPNNPKYTDTIPDLSGYATKAELSGKVDKVEGKGLSSNDFTNLERHKLHKLPDAEEFAEEWDKKANRTEIPKKISELENDKAFKTESEIQSMIEKASSLKKEVVTSLPTTGKDDVIYLVKDKKGKDNNNYLEYLWLNGKYELIGSTQVDLSGYAKIGDILASKIVDKYVLTKNFRTALSGDQEFLKAVNRDMMTLVVFGGNDKIKFASEAGFESILYYKGQIVGVSLLPMYSQIGDTFVKQNQFPEGEAYITSGLMLNYNRIIQSQFTELKSTQSNYLDKNKDKAVVDSDTDYSNNTLYTTPYFVQQAIGIQMSEQLQSVSDYVEEELKKKLNTSDIQEFTQQELEEAFK